MSNFLSGIFSRREAAFKETDFFRNVGGKGTDGDEAGFLSFQDTLNKSFDFADEARATEDRGFSFNEKIDSGEHFTTGSNDDFSPAENNDYRDSEVEDDQAVSSGKTFAEKNVTQEPEREESHREVESEKEKGSDEKKSGEEESKLDGDTTESVEDEKTGKEEIEPEEVENEGENEKPENEDNLKDATEKAAMDELQIKNMTHKKNIKVSSSDNKKGLGVKDGKAEAETEKTGEKTSSGKTPSGEKDKVNTDGNSQVSRNFNKAVNKNSAEVSDAAVNNAKNSSDAKQTGKASSRENGNMNSELFAGVKIKNIKSENTSAGNEAFQGRGEREFKNDPQSLLKTLLNKSHTLASRIKLTDSVKDTAGESMKNTLEPEISGGGFVNIKNAGAMEKLMDTISKSFAENTRGVAGDKAQPDIAEGAGNSPVFEGLSIKNGLPSGAQASSSTQMSSGSSANVYVVQEMISRMQGMIRGSNLDSGSKLSMNFESKNFGQVSLALQDKNGTLSVSIQIGNESSRQELMDQREELAQQLRMMGYKDVELDISEDGAHDEKQKENKNKGNEDIDNVKLAGDDIADRNEIFSGNFMA